MLMVGKDRHGWTKASALFEKPDDAWGRMALLRLQPRWPDGDGSELDLLVPPDFTAEPSTSSDSLRQIEDDILSFLRQNNRTGQWQPQTAVLKAGGDKNGRRGQVAALERLIKANVIETREIDIRGGRTGAEYRHVDLEDPNSESP